MKKSKEETEHAENLAKFQLERDGTIWAGNALSNTGKCRSSITSNNLWVINYDSLSMIHSIYLRFRGLSWNTNNRLCDE